MWFSKDDPDNPFAVRMEALIGPLPAASLGAYQTFFEQMVDWQVQWFSAVWAPWVQPVWPSFREDMHAGAGAFKQSLRGTMAQSGYVLEAGTEATGRAMEAGAEAAGQAFEAGIDAARDLSGEMTRIGSEAGAEVMDASRNLADTAAGVMTEAVAEAAGETDDLTAIDGIGPALAQRLADAGITRYRQIAAWTEQDIEKFENEVLEGNLRGRILRDDWVGQAGKLVR